MHREPYRFEESLLRLYCSGLLPVSSHVRGELALKKGEDPRLVVLPAPGVDAVEPWLTSAPRVWGNRFFHALTSKPVQRDIASLVTNLLQPRYVDLSYLLVDGPPNRARVVWLPPLSIDTATEASHILQEGRGFDFGAFRFRLQNGLVECFETDHLGQKIPYSYWRAHRAGSIPDQLLEVYGSLRVHLPHFVSFERTSLGQETVPPEILRFIREFGDFYIKPAFDSAQGLGVVRVQVSNEDLTLFTCCAESAKNIRKILEPFFYRALRTGPEMAFHLEGVREDIIDTTLKKLLVSPRPLIVEETLPPLEGNKRIEMRLFFVNLGRGHKYYGSYAKVAKSDSVSNFSVFQGAASAEETLQRLGYTGVKDPLWNSVVDEAAKLVAALTHRSREALTLLPFEWQELTCALDYPLVAVDLMAVATPDAPFEHGWGLIEVQENPAWEGARGVDPALTVQLDNAQVAVDAMMTECYAMGTADFLKLRSRGFLP